MPSRMQASAPTPCKYTVSGLFHSPLGVLFTFPSRYWFTIGHRTYLALPVSSGRFTRAIRVSSYSRIQTRVVIYFTYGAITLWGAASKQLRLYRHFVTLPPINRGARILQPPTPKSRVWAFPFSLAAT